MSIRIEYPYIELQESKREELWVEEAPRAITVEKEETEKQRKYYRNVQVRWIGKGKAVGKESTKDSGKKGRDSTRDDNAASETDSGPRKPKCCW